MKKILFLLLAGIPFIAFGQKAKIEFDKTSHNFATISESGGRVSYDFTFKNTGSVPLILNNVQSGCGCTTPEWSKKPVSPGQTGNIKVSFDPRNRPGAFVKSITVYSNAENKVISLTIRGNVTRKKLDPYAEYTFPVGSVRAISSTVNLGTINNKQTVEKKLEIINTGDKPAAVAVSTPAKHITATVQPVTLNKGEKGTILIKYNPALKNEWGQVEDKLDMIVNNIEKGGITISANISEDFSTYQKNGYQLAPIVKFSEEETDLGDINAKTVVKHDFFIQNEGKSDLHIRKIQCPDQSISAVPAKTVIKPGKHVKVTITLKAEEAGKMTKTIAFTLNDPKNTVVTYKVSGKII